MQDTAMAEQVRARVASVAEAEQHSMDVTASDVYVTAALNHERAGVIRMP